MSETLWLQGLQHARLPYPYYLPEFAQMHVCWVGDAIQRIVAHPLPPSSPFAFYLSQQQVVSSESPLCLSIGVSASASVFSMNIQGWFPLGLTGLIFLQSRRLSRVFFNTTIWKHHIWTLLPCVYSMSVCGCVLVSVCMHSNVFLLLR